MAQRLLILKIKSIKRAAVSKNTHAEMYKPLFGDKVE